MKFVEVVDVTRCDPGTGEVLMVPKKLNVAQVLAVGAISWGHPRKNTTIYLANGDLMDVEGDSNEIVAKLEAVA